MFFFSSFTLSNSKIIISTIEDYTWKIGSESLSKANSSLSTVPQNVIAISKGIVGTIAESTLSVMEENADLSAKHSNNADKCIWNTLKGGMYLAGNIAGATVCVASAAVAFSTYGILKTVEFGASSIYDLVNVESISEKSIMSDPVDSFIFNAEEAHELANVEIDNYFKVSEFNSFSTSSSFEDSSDMLKIIGDQDIAAFVSDQPQA